MAASIPPKEEDLGEPLATYSFLPWLRRGLAAGIERVDGSPDVKPRVEIPIEIALEGVKDPVKVKLALYGPGDVVNFDQRAVIRTWPGRDVFEAEPNYFPLVEFDQPDLPWRYTPAKATNQDRLRPWLCLIVLRDDEIVSFEPADPRGRLPALKVSANAALPKLDQSWAWAHVQVTGALADDAALAKLLDQEPERALARLLCPRRLDGKTPYNAFLVPSFERARLAGLRQKLDDSIDGLQPAWLFDNKNQHNEVVLPVYYHWRFQTGGQGDFESLVRLLKPRELPVEVGTRAMDVSKPGEGLPAASKAPLGLEGALRALTSKSSAWDADERKVWLEKLTEPLNRPAKLLAEGDRTVAPPLYGRWHAATATVEPGKRPPWFQELNTDPRLRTSAGLGALVVQEQREQLMAGAWAQVDRIRKINEELRNAQLAREVSTRIFERHIESLDPDSFLTLTSKIFSRVPTGGGNTVREQLRESPIPSGVFQSQFRRLRRALGPVGRRQGKAVGRAPSTLFERLNSNPAALSPPVQAMRNPSAAPISGLAGQQAASAMAPGGGSKVGRATAFRQAAAQVFQAAAAAAPAKVPVDLGGVRQTVLGALHPSATIGESTAARMLLRGLMNWAPKDPIEPVMAAPEFPQPMYEPLRDLSQEWLLPGLDKVPANTLGLLVTNQRFVEAYMVGLNFEMARALLYEDYPTDQRGTYFRQFWDTRGYIPPVGVKPGEDDLKDIRPIPAWPKTASLGDNTSRKLPGQLVLLIRGEVLRRYPNSIVYAVKATLGKDGKHHLTAEEKHPLFHGVMEPDVTFLGFDLTQVEARGDRKQNLPGWFFVLQEQPSQPRFGLDEAGDPIGGNPKSWTDLSWGHLATDAKTLAALGYIDLAANLPDASQFQGTKPPQWRAEPENGVPGARSSDLAYITLQLPVRVAVHASEMIPGAEAQTMANKKPGGPDKTNPPPLNVGVIRKADAPPPADVTTAPTPTTEPTSPTEPPPSTDPSEPQPTTDSTEPQPTDTTEPQPTTGGFPITTGPTTPTSSGDDQPPPPIVSSGPSRVDSSSSILRPPPPAARQSSLSSNLQPSFELPRAPSTPPAPPPAAKSRPWGGAPQGPFNAGPPGDEFSRLSAEYPLALFPVRIETRFSTKNGPPELWVRVYPDEIFADTHEPELTPEEHEAGRTYWRATRDAKKEGDAQAAWSALVLRFPAARAAWIAHATAPEHIEQAGTRAESWTRGALARTLPDRWVVVAYRGPDEVRRAVGQPITPDPLTLTLSPKAPEQTVPVAGDDHKVADELAWTIDFQRAVDQGMAIKVSIDANDLAKGFDRLIVLGVKTLAPEAASERLAALLDAHHYARGLAFVAQGTPTNNTDDSPSKFPPTDENGRHSFAVERGASLQTPKGDGTRFMQALGVDPRLAAHVEGAERMEAAAARAMNNALWPATLGYFLSKMALLDDENVADTRDFFVENVLARGRFPAFRVGNTPYGLLPITSFARYVGHDAATRAEASLPDALRHVLPAWRDATAQVPRVGGSADPDRELVQILAMGPSAQEIGIRPMYGPEFHYNLSQLLDADWAAWERGQQQIIFAVEADSGLNLGKLPGAWLHGAPEAPHFKAPFVDDTLSETDGIAGFNYIRWIREASTSAGAIERLRDEQLPNGIKPPPFLLYRLLRHAALVEYARLGHNLLVEHGVIDANARNEHEMRGIGDDGKRATVWDQLALPIPQLTGKMKVGDYLFQDHSLTYDAISRYRDSLEWLEKLPTAELHRLFTESLDLCSHRIDAWIGAFAGKRLEKMRKANPAGVHLGAFAWVEDLRADPPARPVQLSNGREASIQANSGGYIHAPSMNHAAAAAVLRNGYLTRTGDERTQFTIDLSSARVRSARWILDSVRNGQNLGAVLGYQFERGLHEREIERFIDPLRRRFPLVADKGERSGEPVEAIAARNVVDGLALRAAWRARTIVFDKDGLPPLVPLLEAELGRLDEAIDAVADLMTAESVYQIVQGNVPAASATLDAMAQGLRPPDPEIARTPRGGISLTHRVALLLGEPAGATPGWPRPTLRAAAEPCLDAWIATLLGDPNRVRCRVTVAGEEHVVTLADLDLRPLDFLAVANGVEATGEESELDHRVVMAAVGETDATDVQIAYTSHPKWDRRSIRSFAEILEVARAVDAVVAAARPLRPEDSLPPELSSLAAKAGFHGEEAYGRAMDACLALRDARSALDAALSVAVKNPLEVPALRTVMRETAAFGIAGAFAPPRRSAKPEGVLSAAAGALAEMDRRLAACASAQAKAAAIRKGQKVDGAPQLDGIEGVKIAQEMVQAVFGRGFVFLPSFTPAAPQDLGRSLDAGPGLVGDPSAVEQWLQQAARVRPSLGRWRRAKLYANALGAPRLRLDVAQMPFDKEKDTYWIGRLPPAGAKLPVSGRVSVVLEQATTPRAQDKWAGLFIDEWTEMIPNRTQTTGIAFHYDDPGAEAAQAVLLAVPPAEAKTWDIATVIDCLRETMDLMKVRGVDGHLLGGLAQLLPAIQLASNPQGHTVSTNLSNAAAGPPRGMPLS